MKRTEETRPGFMIFFEDWEVAMQLMEAEEFHAFFTAAFHYARDGELPDESKHTKIFNVFFENMSRKLDNDKLRYDQRVEQTRIAGRKSALARMASRQEAYVADIEETTPALPEVSENSAEYACQVNLENCNPVNTNDEYIPTEDDYYWQNSITDDEIYADFDRIIENRKYED